MTASAPADAGQEFDQYEATGAVPPSPAVDQGTDPEPGATRPALTVRRIARPLETIRVDGALYEFKYLFHYSLGKQSALINAYNTCLAFMEREESFGDDLDQDETDQRRFLLERIVRAALPAVPRADLAAWELADLEAVALRFFVRSRELRDQAAQAAPPPTSAA
jgi:hypothetical protein